MNGKHHQRKESSAGGQPEDEESSLLCAGFVLIRTAQVPAGLDERPLLTKDVTSVCECIYPRFPHIYAIEWCEADDDERDEAFEEMGVPKKLREPAIDWATDSFEHEHGAWGVFFTIDSARAAYDQFLKKSTGVRLIGLGVHRDDAATFIKENTPPPPEAGSAPEGVGGHVHILKEKHPLPPGGQLLGYEPLVTSHRVVGCSWLCNGLEETLAKELGIKPNKLGLIKDYVSAKRLTDRINQGDTGAEPGTWMPWALVEYRLT